MIELNDIQIGQHVDYFPSSQPGVHFQATIEAIGKRIKIRYYCEGGASGIVRYTTLHRLTDRQLDMFCER